MVIEAQSNRSIGNNIPELSVSDLALALKRTLEEGFARVRVRGELSKVSLPASGHLYTAIKDDSALIDAVCWKSQMPRLKIKPAEGLEVIVTGRITTYPARSTYQLVIEQMELAGVGAILKMLEDRRIKLAAEGLFDDTRKRPLPFLPRTIGIITSPTGAVIRDILHRLSDRFPVNVIIWPVTVQGDTAASEVTAAINGFNALPADGSIPRPDVLIVARGGGSLEDLMPFNEEIVVRAAANSKIPLISAVGHETDTTLIDYASDRRAPTPTAAAEFAVPVRDDLALTTQEYALRLTRALTRVAREQAHRLDALGARLGTPQQIFELPAQKIDHLDRALSAAFARTFDRATARLATATARLRHPAQYVGELARVLDLHSGALIRAGARLLDDPQKRLLQGTRLLETLSFQGVLARGYAVVRDQSGHVVAKGDQLSANDGVNIMFGDKTTVSATVTGKKQA